MSAPAPQVLSRKANWTSNEAAGQGSDQASVRHRVKGPEDSSNASKSGKGRRAAGKRGSAKNKTEGDAPSAKASSRPRAYNEGEKLVIRRLPPGMTQQECQSILGADWEVSRGKVDWFSYVPGKISTDPSKPSRPSRAYVHLMRKDDIMPLSELVRSSAWEDAKSTSTNPALVGPPVLEVSIYKKASGTKKRIDARQGTIDQDPEFMEFLQGLANPAPMRDSIDVEDLGDNAKVENKVTTTPLVEYLREKKASKGKDGGGSGKNSKTGGKGKGGSKDDDSYSKKKGKEMKVDKADKPVRETVMILTKKAATEQAVETARKTASQITAANATPSATAGASASASASASATADAPKSRRAGIAAAARILQRDLGLSPGSAHRRARHDAAKAEADAKPAVAPTKENDAVATDAPPVTVTEKVSLQSDVSPAQTSKGRSESPSANKSQPGRRNRGGRTADKGKGAAAGESSSTPAQPTATKPPIILKKKNESAMSPKTAETQTPNQKPSSDSPNNNRTTPKDKDKGNAKQSQKKAPSVSANARRAFVKHVSASQGVNDASLREVLGNFGTVTLVEIDKRKGFAFVDFSEHDALVKAVAASPVSIGQGSVQVLERKDKKPATAAASTTPVKEGSAVNGDKEKPSGGRGRRDRGGGSGVGGGGGGGVKAGGGSTKGQNTNSSATQASKEATAHTGG